ncbi:hypothetical protein Lal_00037453 [Lupinus albus]|uniref:Putative BRCT domain-containing protein n=1 Tax=Lupinus albus TaxID=3870 RepID=A0A6A5P0V0_LUPAL|nr:putative BRCT domain-containing protein [Lupinus albus]KAF1890882.1 hypothetical protein Lal_00037453 [Lupinus albus]
MSSASDSDAKHDPPINTVHDTEPFYDPFDGDNENMYVENTVPFDYDIDGDDALLSEEGETEQLILAGETQRLDDFDDSDSDCDTQVFDEERGAGGTEVLENVDSDDPHCVDTAQSQDTDEKKKLLEESDTVPHGKTNSGLVPPRYTFLRAESLRQASLATRNMALKQTQIETNSVMDVSQSCRETLAVNDNGEPVHTPSEKVCGVGQENHRGKDSVEVVGSMDKNMCKVASTAVRKLFIDDLTFETNESSLISNDLNEEDSLDKLPIYHDDLAGLSYINSQEPGDLSQINALDFVDKFLKDNVMDLDQEIRLVKNVEEKSKSLPPSKGQQSLARRVSDRGKSGETGIYDWDDSCEDEGGGDIFLRRKEDFFDGGIHKPKSLPGLQKIKVRRSNDEKQSSFPKKRKITVRSDTRPGMLNLKVRDNTVQEATGKLKRNLANELDEQFKTNCSGGEVEPNPKAHVQEMSDVGIDTQMAAEAMEALCNANDIVDNVANDVSRVTRSRKTDQLNSSTTVKAGSVTSKECSRQYDRKRKVDNKSDLQTSGLSRKHTKKVRQCRKDNVMTRSMKSKLNADGNQTCNSNENDRIVSSPVKEQRKSAETLKRHQLDEVNNLDINGSGGRTVNKNHLHSEVCHFTPIARRTRQSRPVNQLKSDISSKSLGGDIANGSHEKRSSIGRHSSKVLDAKSTPGSFGHFKVDDNTELCELETLAPKASAVSVNDDVEMGTIDCPKRRRSIRIRKLSNNDKGSEKVVGPSKPSAQPEDIGKSTASMIKTRTGSRSVVKSLVNCRTQSSLYGGSEKSSIDQKQGTALEPNLDKVITGDTPICYNVTDKKDANLNSIENNNADAVLCTNNFEVTNSDETPRERYKSHDLAFATPANCKRPVNDASPVCMGDGYYKQSCNRNVTSSCLLRVFRTELRRELLSLSAIKPELTTPSKDSRKRRDMTDVRILYSHHLDEDIVKHQKKVLSRLGVSVASSIADATHFIADQFVRTRNMLEAIAYGKPVVTHLWIESCGQASCFIDERNYILRDAKKEKEIGFSMPVSLARASQHPLLEGRKVLITPNAKPSKEIISSLVKAVQGQAVERIGRSALKDHKVPDDLLILSCEQDYSSCVPFLEKGAVVCTSELLLNGIVTQKLEYERHRLFADQVKKTRSTIWLKRDEKTFIPVTKCS